VEATLPIGPYHTYPSMSPADVFSGVYHNITPSASVPSPMLGTEVRLWHGAVFRYAHNAEGATAIAQGNTVIANTTQTNADNTITAYDAAEAKLTTSTALTAGAEVGSIFYIDAGTGVGQSRIIVANTVTQIWLDRALDTATDTTSDWTIIPLFRLLQGVASGATCGVMPFATSIAAGNRGWIQTAGFCEAVLAGAAITANDLLLADATAGRAGPAAAGGAETDTIFGVALATASDGELFPAMLAGMAYS